MSEQTDNLLSLLQPYGLEIDEARVYLELLESGVGSALALSRKLKIARTRVYRMLDKLEKLSLVVVRLHERGNRYEASNVKKLGLLINEKEREVESLRSSLPVIEEQLGKIVRESKRESKVLYYKGVEGVKQVSFNSLKAKGELLTMEIKDLGAFFSHKEAEELRLKFIDRKIQIKTLTNVKKLLPWTQVGREMVEKYWEIRHVPESQMKIKFEILIYNDVYVMYRYDGKEVFCVEIYNQELADMQRQVFGYMWKKARRFKVLNSQGEARLVE
ncbi:MAG: helix-turn-helix domain-containing protein [Candidatus Beckwithbacteria bacterium]|nr:hypothetical protein [Patescibacteria group bacterium]